MRVLEGRIKKRITPVRDGNYGLFVPYRLIYFYIKKRITPVRDGNFRETVTTDTTTSVDGIKKRITPVRDGN